MRTIEGKTKIITPLDGNIVRVASKDDLTAGDGKRHEIAPGKGALSNQTTVNVFELLRHCGIPVAYRENLEAPNEHSQLAVDMQPFEVVARRISDGSCPKRHPEFPAGHYFEVPRVELYLKTSERVWNSISRTKSYALECDDPFALVEDKVVSLYHPARPITQGLFMVRIDEADVFPSAAEKAMIKEMERIARNSFRILERAFLHVDARLVDFKVEFGVGPDGALYLADVIDCDSWRLRYHGESLDKQPFRDGEPVEQTLRRYKTAAWLTDSFKFNRDRIREWRETEVKLAA